MIKKELLKEFKIRVYGIIVQNGQVLLSQEKYQHTEFCKFPGGGMELGESSKECLVREFKEELQIEIVKSELLHACETVVQNQFNKAQQVLGLYYLVTLEEDALKTIEEKLNDSFRFDELKHERRFWCSAEKLDSVLSFAMDKDAAKFLLEKLAIS